MNFRQELRIMKEAAWNGQPGRRKDVVIQRRFLAHLIEHFERLDDEARKRHFTDRLLKQQLHSMTLAFKNHYASHNVGYGVPSDDYIARILSGELDEKNIAQLSNMKAMAEKHKAEIEAMRPTSWHQERYKPDDYVQIAPKGSGFGHNKSYRYRVMARDLQGVTHHTNCAKDAMKWFEKCRKSWLEQDNINGSNT